MNGYKYQMHAHTYPASACGDMLPHELVDELYSGGYSGCVLTNHFLNGNTAFDRNLPWEDFVKAFSSDYRFAKKRAEKYGIDIIFGLEEHIGEGKEILCYGITPEILTANPALASGDVQIWHRIMQENGCLCIQAHPFRSNGFIENPGVVSTEFIDGIEVFNAGNSEKDNASAEEFAKANPDFIQLSGGDAHSVSRVCSGGIVSPCRIRNEKELVEALKSGKYNLIK